MQSQFKMRQIFLFPPPYRSIRPTAIPSFHPNISLFHQRHQSSSMPPSMPSVKYILATKSSLPVSSSSWMGGGRLLVATRFVRMAADGVEAEGGIISRISFLSIPSSFPFFRLLSFSLRLFTRMKRPHLTRNRVSLRSLFLCRLQYAPSSTNFFFSLFYLDVPSPSPVSMHSRDSP